jgi:V/A-type H+/Na+-transporting ATPase subunit F
MSLRPTAQSGKIAVVGERELVLGYRLLGVEATFIATRENAQKLLMELFDSNNYGLIIAGNEVQKALSVVAREKLEASIVPLVVFMPPIGQATQQEESLAKLARRVLGVDLKVAA